MYVVIKQISKEILGGSIDLKPFSDIDNRPSFTMDYKLPSSGAEDEMLLTNLSLVENKDVVKFVMLIAIIIVIIFYFFKSVKF